MAKAPGSYEAKKILTSPGREGSILDMAKKENGPVYAALLESWNKIHDAEWKLQGPLGTYDHAASFVGAPGQQDAKVVIKAVQEARDALERVSEAFEAAASAEQDFIDSHGHPEGYIRWAQNDFGLW